MANNSRKDNVKGFSFFAEYKKSLYFLKSCERQISFIIAMFLLSAFIGYFFPNFFEEQILNFLAGLIDKTKGFSSIEMISFLFRNNLTSAFTGMLLGVFFGIFPVVNALINGYLIGFVANKVVEIKGLFILWRLFPHGIFELPALFLSLGVGLKLGSVFFQKKKFLSFYRMLSEALRVFFLIIAPLLFIAAIIEGTLIVLLG